jgi:hypothetical protein
MWQSPNAAENRLSKAQLPDYQLSGSKNSESILNFVSVLESEEEA